MRSRIASLLTLVVRIDRLEALVKYGGGEVLLNLLFVIKIDKI